MPGYDSLGVWSAIAHLPLCLLIGMHQTGIVVLSTVVPTSFMGVDSFDKTRFVLIAGGPSLSLQETESGRVDISSFHLIAQQ